MIKIEEYINLAFYDNDVVMATLQEVDKQEQELNTVQQQAQKVLATGIPQRKFGSGVTAKQQTQVIQNKAQAQQVLSDVDKQRNQLEQVKAQISSQEAYNYDYQRAEAINRGVPGRFENQRQIEIYTQLRRNEQINAGDVRQAKSFQEAGLKPIYKDGKLVGVEDSVRGQSIELSKVPQLAQSNPEVAQRYQQAGLITIDKSSSANIQYVRDSSGQIVGGRDYSKQVSFQINPKVNLNKPSAIQGNEQSSPRRPSVYANNGTDNNSNLSYYGTVKKTVKNEVSQIISGFRAKKDTTLDLPGYENMSSQQILEAYQKSSSYKQTQSYYSNPKQRQLEELKFYASGTSIALFPLASSVAISLKSFYNIGRSGFSAEGVGKEVIPLASVVIPYGISKTVKFFREPVVAYDISKDIQFASKDISYAVKETNLDLARFNLVGYRPPTRVRVLSRTDILLEKAYPTVEFGKEINLDKGYTTLTTTGLIPIKEGVIVKPTPTATQAIGKRKSQITLSYLEGGSFKGEVNVAKNLPKETRRKIEAVLEREYGKPFNLDNYKTLTKEVLKEQSVQMGEALVTDRFKLTSRGKVKPVPYGKSQTTAELLTAMKELEIKGLPEGTTYYKSVSAVEDITLPKTIKNKGGTPRPRRLDTINSITKRVEIEGPKYSGNSVETNQVTKQVSKTNLQALEQAKASVVASIKKPSKLSSKQILSKLPTYSEQSLRSLPTIVGGTGKLASAYSGRGQYERTGYNTSTKTIQRDLSKGLLRVSNPSVSIDRGTTLTKSLNKSLNKELPREITKEISLGLNKEVTKQLNKLTQKQVPKQSQKLTQKVTPKLSSYKISKPSKVVTLFNKKPSNLKQSYFPGYRTYIQTGKTKTYLSGVRPIGLAEYVGAEKVQSSLKATFGIERTNVRTSQKDINYKVPSSTFRNYRIVRGQKVKTNNVFIQKTRKEGGLFGGRLNFSQERKAIQQARMFR